MNFQYRSQLLPASDEGKGSLVSSLTAEKPAGSESGFSWHSFMNHLTLSNNLSRSAVWTSQKQMAVLPGVAVHTVLTGVKGNNPQFPKIHILPSLIQVCAWIHGIPRRILQLSIHSLWPHSSWTRCIDAHNHPILGKCPKLMWPKSSTQRPCYCLLVSWNRII